MEGGRGWHGVEKKEEESQLMHIFFSTKTSPASYTGGGRRPSKAQNCEGGGVVAPSCCACSLYMVVRCAAAASEASAAEQRQVPPEMADTQRRVPATQPRSRLKWTRQLHERFVEAVSALGGAHKATPKSVKKEMGVPDLTLYHLKSHLQKYRLAVKRNPDVSCIHGEEADCSAQKSRGAHDSMAGDQTLIDRNMFQIRKPEVRSKSDQHIEVQRHLQLRIEAEGRYLQTALMRAQEMLAGRGIDSAAGGAAASGFSEVLPAVDIERLSSSCSGGNRYQRADCSGDSCLTTWESPETKTGKPSKHEIGLLHQSLNEDAEDISSSAGKPVESLAACDSETENRGGSIHCRGNCDQGGLPGCSSRGHSRHRKSCYRVAEEIDLNREPTLPTHASIFLQVDQC